MNWFARLAAALLLLGAAAAHAASPPNGRIVLPDDVVPLHYDLAIVPNAAQATFTGRVEIELEAQRPTRTVQLNAADLTFDRVTLDGATPKIALDPKRETATFTFARPIAAGRHRLDIDYAGRIAPHAAGLFWLDYDTPSGKKRGLYTQFENSDARRFLPCWDEPARKATFTLTATVPAADLAVSNTPVAATEMLPEGKKRVRFAISPKMSSYLLFFAAGDFERVTRTVDGVEIGIVAKRGDAAKGSYALAAAAQILPWYESYFGVKYPLPKLDLVAAPGGSQFFGAMENWGAIFFFERDLLIDPQVSTPDDERTVYEVVAHEMAHMWFGDLVTMEWWDDLWLNEGFASWMENKVTGVFHPEWNPGLEGIDSRERALRTDALRGTHPVVQPIHDVLQAGLAFDSITYSKGSSVLRMLESAAGPDRFRDGVRAYIKAHAYGNAVSDDLWRALDAATPTHLTRIAHDFTLEAGVPLLRVAAIPGGVRLTQGEFVEDEAGREPAVWHVPVTVRGLGTAAVWHGIVARGKPADVKLPGGAPAVVNAGQRGYFRVLYAPPTLAPLLARFAELPVEDQLGLLNDAQALGLAGQEPLSDFLSMVAQAAGPAMDPALLERLVRRLEEMDDLYVGLPAQASLHVFGRKLLDPLFTKIGWEARPGENPSTGPLREVLLEALSDFDDPAVIAGARERFARLEKDPGVLSNELRRSVLDIVAYHADAPTWERLHARAREARNSLAQRRGYQLLGSVHDPALARRALDLALSAELPVTLRATLLGTVGRWHPEMAFELVTRRWKEVAPLLEPDSRASFAPRLAARAHDAATIARLRAFAAAHIPPTARRAAVSAEAAIARTVRIRQERLPEASRWLASHF